MLRWARERTGIPADAKPITRRFPRHRHWEQGEVQPTLRQLKEFARVSNIEPSSTPFNAVESWCHKFAVEVLVPIEGFREEYRSEVLSPTELKRLSRKFKVSPLMILRRLYDLGVLARDQFQAAYDEELERTRGRGLGSGGDF